MAEIVTNTQMRSNQIQTEMAESFDVMKAINLKPSTMQNINDFFILNRFKTQIPKPE